MTKGEKKNKQERRNQSTIEKKMGIQILPLPKNSQLNCSVNYHWETMLKF